jgi:type II secretion system protein J
VKASGYTLLELLLAVSLLAVVAAVGHGLLTGGLTARRVVADASAQSRTPALALDQVCRCLESALPPTGVLAGEFVGADGGDSDELAFHASLDPYGTRWSDVVRVRFYVESDGQNGTRLMRGLTRNLLASVTPQEHVQTVCRRVGSFEAQYFDGSNWFDDWDSGGRGNALPVAVRLTLALRDPSAEEGDDTLRAPMERIVLLATAAAAGSESP